MNSFDRNICLKEKSTFSEANGCIRELYRLFDGRVICTKFLSNENQFSVEIIPFKKPFKENLSGHINKIIFSREDSHIFEVLPFVHSLGFVYVFEEKIVVDRNGKKEEVSHKKFVEQTNNWNTPGKATKDQRERKYLKNPIMFHDRFVLFVLKKKRIVIHDIQTLKSEIFHPPSNSNDIPSSILRIRKFSDLKNQLVCQVRTLIYNSKREFRIYEVNEFDLKQLTFVKKIIVSDFPRKFIGINKCHMIGLSGTKGYMWHGLEEKDFQIPESFLHDIPIGNKLYSGKMSETVSVIKKS